MAKTAKKAPRKTKTYTSEQPGVESHEISEGVMLDDDAKGTLVGIDIDNASRKVQLKELILSKLPGKVHTVGA